MLYSQDVKNTEISARENNRNAINNLNSQLMYATKANGIKCFCRKQVRERAQGVQIQYKIGTAMIL